MNLIKDIFYEYFNKYYYSNNTGRAYCEYILDEGKQYKGKICFFHFSLNKSKKLNSFFAIKILLFIKCFYSNAFIELYIIIKYCINNNIVVSINSLSEYKFIIKFKNENIIIRKLLKNIILKYTNCSIEFEKYINATFFELVINLYNEKFEIELFKGYIISDINSVGNITYQEGYLEKNNIFIVFKIDNYDFVNNINYNTILFKLTKPIKFINSQYLMDTFYLKYLYKYFKSEDIYLSFIEKGTKNDVLYFTKGYSIKA